MTDARAGELERAVEILRAGGVVIMPTESCYGLAANTFCAPALSRIAELKGRAENVPFAAIAADLTQARRLLAHWPPRAQELADEYWPGPLTLVIGAVPGIDARLVGPSGGVGVRVSSHPLARELAKRLGAPISATSANPSGQLPATTVSEARAYFGDAVDLYLDGGRCASEVSTVARVDADGRIEVLRSGAVSLPETALPPAAES